MSRGLMHLAVMLMLHGAAGMEKLMTVHGLSIRVNIPDTSSASEGVPLVVFLHGTGVDPSWGDTDVLAEGAAQEGFAFAIIEYPHWDGSDHDVADFSFELYCTQTIDKAAKLFGFAETTSLSVLCAFEGIDCSKGVGVAGYSQGAAIGSMAAKLDHRVTAFFGIALNTATVYYGVEEFESTCHRDATLSHSARRYLAGGDDADWNPDQTPVVISGTTYGNLEMAKYQLKATSGYDCGGQLDCLQADGSGYFIVPDVSHVDIYPFSFDADWAFDADADAYGAMLNGFAWLMGRTVTDAPGCPCPAEHRRKLLFGSMPASACCARF